MTKGLEGVLNLLFIGVVGAGNLGIRDEENFVLGRTVELFVLIACEVEVTRGVVARARLDQDTALFTYLLRAERLFDLCLSDRNGAGSSGCGAENGSLDEAAA